MLHCLPFLIRMHSLVELLGKWGYFLDDGAPRDSFFAIRALCMTEVGIQYSSSRKVALIDAL